MYIISICNYNHGNDSETLVLKLHLIITKYTSECDMEKERRVHILWKNFQRLPGWDLETLTVRVPGCKYLWDIWVWRLLWTVIHAIDFGKVEFIEKAAIIVDKATGKILKVPHDVSADDHEDALILKSGQFICPRIHWHPSSRPSN